LFGILNKIARGLVSNGLLSSLNDVGFSIITLRNIKGGDSLSGLNNESILNFLADNGLSLLDNLTIVIGCFSEGSLNFGDFAIFDACLNRDFSGLDDFIVNEEFGGGGLNDSNDVTIRVDLFLNNIGLDNNDTKIKLGLLNFVLDFNSLDLFLGSTGLDLINLFGCEWSSLLFNQLIDMGWVKVGIDGVLRLRDDLRLTAGEVNHCWGINVAAG